MKHRHPSAPPHRTAKLVVFAALLHGPLTVPAVAQVRARVSEDTYNRAERVLPWHADDLVSGDEVDPSWLEDGFRFWYRNRTADGHEFVFVDPERRSREALFDHHRLAAAMSLANDSAYEGRKLPFESFEWVDELRSIAFRLGEKRFECDIRDYQCTVGDTTYTDTPYVESPDGRWEAFVVEHDLWVRPTGGGDSVRVTDDGEPFWAYGLGYPRPNQVRREQPPRPSLRWSPDGRRIVVSRRDERNVEHMHYVSMTPQRPVHYSQPYALPGDSIIPYPGMHVITLDYGDAAADQADGPPGERVRVVSNHAVDLEPRPHRSSFGGSRPDSAWSRDGTRLHVTYFTRGSQRVYLAEVNAGNGEARPILGDSTQTFVELHSGNGPASWWVGETRDDVIWWSERDGWGHLYRFDRQGNLKNQITSGPWVVGHVAHVDEEAGLVYFTGKGRDPDLNPYYEQLYRVGFDGSDLTLLTPEAAAHRIEFSPDGRFFVDAYARVEQPPVTVVRAAPDGRVVTTLEEADVSRLEAVGWEPARVFSVKARDGVTDLYGILYLPPDLDPDGSYPIISHIYPGPQRGSVNQWWFTGGHDDQAMAQLGFVVIQLDALGSPRRSKRFHDQYYGDFNDNGIPDHVAALKELAARHSFIDLDRVGMYGHSGGGFATADAMFRFPDFFDVGVSGAGNHDNRSYNIYWAEKYQGVMEVDSAGEPIDHFEEEANRTHAANLEGKLLLMHGDMDDNVHPAMTIQVVNELIEANRDFDLVIAPDRGHGLNEPYFVRRRWDYFVRHLLGAEPPEYEIVRPEN